MTWLQNCLRITGTHEPDRCTVAPDPDLSDRIRAQMSVLARDEAAHSLPADVKLALPRRPGLNDGLIIPGTQFPLGTPVDRVRSAAADRAPLRGTVNVVVVLVDFEDRQMQVDQQHFQDLFFSEGVLQHGSVKEYFDDVSHGLISLAGEVVGPYRMPETLATYAGDASGTGSRTPNARTMARHAARAADPDVDFGPYDNDDNGFVDAFVMVHAGRGAEVTGSPSDIWSHKWVLSGLPHVSDGTSVYGYLTVPEDCRIGVCAHELGHLLFGLPDLYDTDNTSEGIGNWCLMAGGSWNGGGDEPAHPSAWCKVQQGWVTVQNVTSAGHLSLPDVKDSHTVHRIWKDGQEGQEGKEFFLLENRQRTGYDAQLPGQGLLVWHIDDSMADNTNETHYRVGLEQADGQQHLEQNSNRGDAGDPFPGSGDNRSFTHASTPDSRSYAGLDSCVALTAISDSRPVMSAQVSVGCAVEPPEPKEPREPADWIADWVRDLLGDWFGGTGRDTAKPGPDQLLDMLSKLLAAGERPGGGSRPGPTDRGEATLEERVARLESIIGERRWPC